MFCCTPRDEHSFFVSCNDRDLEKLNTIHNIDTGSKKLDMVYLCSIFEKMLNGLVEGVESEKKQQKTENEVTVKEETGI